MITFLSILFVVIFGWIEWIKSLKNKFKIYRNYIVFFDISLMALLFVLMFSLLINTFSTILMIYILQMWVDMYLGKLLVEKNYQDQSKENRIWINRFYFFHIGFFIYIYFNLLFAS